MRSVRFFVDFMTSRQIPRQIIQFWDRPDSMPGRIAEALRSWSRESDYASHVFDGDEARSFLRSNLAPKVVEAYDRATHPALKSDLFRYAALSVLGGIYVDADDVCRRFPRQIIARSPGLSLVRKFNGLVSNNFIVCEQGHAVLQAATEQTTHNILHRVSNNIAEVSGPHVIDDLARAATPGTLEILSFPEFRRHVSSSQPENGQAHWSQFQERNSIFVDPIDPTAPGLFDMIEKVAVPVGAERDTFLRSGREDFFRLHRMLQRNGLYLAAMNKVAIIDDPGLRLSRWFYILQRTLDITWVHEAGESPKVPAPLNFAAQGELAFAYRTDARPYDLIVTTRTGPTPRHPVDSLACSKALVLLGDAPLDPDFVQAICREGFRIAEADGDEMVLLRRSG
jgi:hypothetical protein